VENDERALLRAAMLARPATVADLAELVESTPEEIVGVVDRLHAAGYLRRDGERLRYQPPGRLIADRLDALADRQERRLHRELAEIRDLTAELPGLVEDWSTGAGSTERTLPIEILHGPDSGTELWRRQLRRGIPTSADAVLPDLHRFLVPNVREQQSLFDGVSRGERRARAVISATEAENPAIRDQLSRFDEAGIEIRMHPRPPGWFWIHDDHTVGIPLTWGEAWPSSVMALHSRPVAAALRELFERLWRESVPALSPERNWTVLLRLMRNGATLEAASRWLGIAPRTGRRRVAAAMNHYGAETLFGLGVAWAESGEHRAAP
jgi:hypothetical protein